MRAAVLVDDDGAAFEGFEARRPGALAEADPFDLVVAISPTARKLTSHPTFRLLNGPLGEDEAAWRRLASFDGFLVPDAKHARATLHLGAGLRVFSPEPGVFEGDGLRAAADALLGRWRDGRRAERDALGDARIDVILRTGGRDAVLLHRAVASLARQSAGRIRLILVQHGAADLDGLQAFRREALTEIAVVEAPGADRSRALAAGLAAVQAPRFALLDDDDYLLEDHFLHLLRAARFTPGPAFAYADILSLDEAQPGGQGLSIFREGPARPPLGAITNRISAHAFLADSSALAGMRFDLWDLKTAEDALLIASLLARSTPVHSPHATCVYAMGRGDGSAYLRHADRAEDELAFALQLAPFRAAIEAKFSAELDNPGLYLAPFFAAQRRAALVAELKARPSGAGLVAVQGDRLVRPVAEDPELAGLREPPAFEALAGFVQRVGETAEIHAETDFSYAAQSVLHEQTSARPLIVAVEARALSGSFGIALADGAHGLATEAEIAPMPFPQEMQLLWDRAATPRLIIRRLHSDAGDASASLTVSAVTLAYPVEALTEGGDRPAALAHLQALAGAPRTVRSSHLATYPTTAPTSVRLEGAADPRPPVDLGEAPWAYAFSTALPSGGTLRVDLEAVEASVHVLRVDAAWSQVGDRLDVPATAGCVQAWMEAVAASGPLRLVIQAGAAPAGGRVTLKGVFLYPSGDAP